MAQLDAEIAVFRGMQQELETHHRDKWVVIRGDRLVGVLDSFDAAATEAVRQFGRGPYLIRQVGAPPLLLPASVMYRPVHADR